MSNKLAQKIDSLPPLPETILKLEEFKKSSQKDPDVLKEIIEQDALIVSTLLKVANSAMFGFNNSIETTGRALSLLGMNFTLSIAFGSAIKNSLDTDLKAYGAASDEFLRISNMASNLLSLWISKTDYELKEELLLPVFLQEAGKFILSDLAKDKAMTDKFLEEVKNTKDVSDTENELLDTTTSKVTAAIFRHWKLSNKLIATIEFVDDLENCPEEHKTQAQILYIVKMICNIVDPLNDKVCEMALEKAKEFKLDAKALEKAIEKMQDRLLDE